MKCVDGRKSRAMVMIKCIDIDGFAQVRRLILTVVASSSDLACLEALADHLV
jgi:hypothetical protein